MAEDTKLVRATKRGFYGGALREPGVVFRVPSSLTAKWFVDASTPAVPNEPAPAADEPMTLSEMGKRGRKGPKVGPAVPNEPAPAEGEGPVI